jgi:hypothetical protein
MGGSDPYDRGNLGGISREHYALRVAPHQRGILGEYVPFQRVIEYPIGAQQTA